MKISPDLYRARTRDGHRIALWRYENKGRRAPVLLVHGLGSNRYDLDAPIDSYSLARFLHADGFDVWVIELRGAGASNHKLRKHLLGFTIDDYIFHDLPAALRLIEDETGEDQVHWAGHSLGGQLAYPIMAAGKEHRLRSCATLGAPAMQKTDHSHLEFTLPFVMPLLRAFPCFWGYKRGLQLGSYFMPLAARIGSRYFFTLENVDLADLAKVARCAIDDVPSGVNLQLLEWYREKRMTTAYGTIDPIAALERSRVPLMVIAGARDGLTPLEDVRIPFDRSGAPSKELVICGRDHGFSQDYGHIDLVFGKRAREEVFPRIRDWFVRHDLPAATGSAARNGAQARASEPGAIGGFASGPGTIGGFASGPSPKDESPRRERAS
ncbi:alpha/beta fold hydrolase [bacterium]|nr:alpha/beta fold hydrolase [bacterium]